MSVPVKHRIPGGCLKALRLQASEICDHALGRKLIIECSDLGTILNLNPDFRALAKVVLPDGCSGVAVTCRGPKPYDFTSRYFNPWAGIDEDPVTGSAHAVLAAYFGKLLKKSTMFAHQASARGGELRIEADFVRERVSLTGGAVIVLSGHIDIDDSRH
jgi:PhzF family phenazine biosynthesis protein